MIIALDFDGTCCKHLHPSVGDEIDGCVDVLRELTEEGHELILWTCRDGYELELAVQWFVKHKLELAAIQSNSPNVPYAGLVSRKIYAHLYIDDRGLGIPLTSTYPDEREHVDWHRCRELLKLKGYL